MTKITSKIVIPSCSYIKNTDHWQQYRQHRATNLRGEAQFHNSGVQEQKEPRPQEVYKTIMRSKTLGPKRKIN